MVQQAGWRCCLLSRGRNAAQRAGGQESAESSHQAGAAAQRSLTTSEAKERPLRTTLPTDATECKNQGRGPVLLLHLSLSLLNYNTSL